jgi:hypothetical protein
LAKLHKSGEFNVAILTIIIDTKLERSMLSFPKKLIMSKLENLKIAIIHEWFVTYAGSERVVEQILNLFPHADLFAVVDFLNDSQRGFIQNKKVTTTFIQNLPFAKTKFRKYLPLMPLAIEQLDLSAYDLIISSSHAVAKGVLTAPHQLHISYMHSPIRYAWDLQHQYLKESNLDRGIKSWIARWILHQIRIWDTRTANGVDLFLANSKFIARRIQKVYRRSAEVIYPSKLYIVRTKAGLLSHCITVGSL